LPRELLISKRQLSLQTASKIALPIGCNGYVFRQSMRKHWFMPKGSLPQRLAPHSRVHASLLPGWKTLPKGSRPIMASGPEAIIAWTSRRCRNWLKRCSTRFGSHPAPRRQASLTASQA
jgi:hypothetical protein